MNLDICYKIMRDYFGDKTSIEPIVNHHLGRHFVFKVTNSRSYVMKFYFKERKWEREISALTLLTNFSYKTPKILDRGITDTIEWLLYEYIEGTTLNTLDLSEDERKEIYFLLGQDSLHVLE